MNKINFSTNWNNKLNNKAYTTIRPFNNKKYHLYCEYDIYYKDIFIGTAEIKKLNVYSIESIPEEFCLLDTGYSKKETIEIINKMYNRNVKALYLIFLKYVNQKSLFDNKEEDPPLLTGGF